jgi:hypothetical protein
MPGGRARGAPRPGRLAARSRPTTRGIVTCALALAIYAGTAGATSAPTRAELAKAKKSLLVLADMPKSWTSSASSGGNEPTPDAAQLARCLGAPLSVVNDNPPTVSSRTFNSKQDLQTVEDQIEVFATAKAAQADLAVAADPKAPKCFTTDFNSPAGRSQLESSFGSDATVGTLDVTRTPAADYGPHTVNITIYFPVTTKGVAINIEFAEVGFVKGNEEQLLTLSSVQSPFPVSLSRHLTALDEARY